MLGTHGKISGLVEKLFRFETSSVISKSETVEAEAAINVSIHVLTVA